MSNTRLPLVSWICLSLAIVPACWSARQDPNEPVLSPAPETPATYAADRPAQLDVRKAKTGHLLVRGLIDGQDRGWFIFDTGASGNAISTPIAEEAGLSMVRKRTIQGASGSAPAQEWRIGKLEIGPLILSDQVVIGTDFSFLEDPLGFRIAGVIGTPTLAHVIADIDVEKPAIAFHEPGAYGNRDVDWQALVLSSGMPTLPVEFEGRDGTFIIDLGSTGTGVFYRKAVDRLGLLEGRATQSAASAGVGGKNDVLKGRLASLVIGGLKHEDVEFAFSRATSGFWAESDATGNLGQELLHDFILTLDFPRGRYALTRK